MQSAKFTLGKLYYLLSSINRRKRRERQLPEETSYKKNCKDIPIITYRLYMIPDSQKLRQSEIWTLGGYVTMLKMVSY